MENMSALKSKIEMIDEVITLKYVDELRAKESRIDFNKEGWVEEMWAIESEYRQNIGPELVYIRRTIGEALAANSFKDLLSIDPLLNNTQRLKDYISPTFGELETDIQSGSHEYLVLSLLLFEARNLGADPRDEMVYFSDLIRFCESKSVDVKPILRQLLPFASNEKKYGTHSVRSIFQQVIEQTASIPENSNQ